MDCYASTYTDEIFTETSPRFFLMFHATNFLVSFSVLAGGNYSNRCSAGSPFEYAYTERSAYGGRLPRLHHMDHYFYYLSRLYLYYIKN